MFLCRKCGEKVLHLSSLNCVKNPQLYSPESLEIVRGRNAGTDPGSPTYSEIAMLENNSLAIGEQYNAIKNVYNPFPKEFRYMAKFCRCTTAE